MEVTSLEFPTLAFTVDDSSQVGEVRRGSQSLAHRLGFTEADQGRVTLIATEAATNIVRHGDGGCIFLRGVFNPTGPGIELLGTDRGNGIENVIGALRDGHSTGGSMGVGLGTIGRQADEFDLFSVPGKGTILYARVLAGDAAMRPGRPTGRCAVGALCLPKKGETLCGDAWAVAPAGSGWLMMVVDGLGHGPHASQASTAAIRLGMECPDCTPMAIIEAMHVGIRSTRGAAAAVALLDPVSRTVRYSGVGNIAGVVTDGSASRSMVSHNGTVGHELRKAQEFVYPWPEGALVIMHSDGLQSHWKLDAYPGLLLRHPSITAAVLHRDFNRGRDDVTVVVTREAEV